MADIVVSEFLDEDALAELTPRWTVIYDPTLVDRTDALHAALAEARAVIVRNRTRVGAPLLAAAPGLRVVGRLGVGLDNIDLDACRARAVEVCPARGTNDTTVAEYVVTAVLMLLRGAFQAHDAVLRGDWPRRELIGREVAGRQLGLVGFGANARETARRAAALGMTVMAHDPYVPADDSAWELARAVDLDTLIAGSDAISVHVPLTADTWHLLDARALAAMRSDAVLVNAARGGIVDEAALVDALRAGRLAGAALDVYETEPLTGEAGRRFADVPNLILTPHIAGVTVEANRRISFATVRSVARVLAGPETGG